MRTEHGKLLGLDVVASSRVPVGAIGLKSGDGVRWMCAKCGRIVGAVDAEGHCAVCRIRDTMAHFQKESEQVDRHVNEAAESMDGQAVAGPSVAGADVEPMASTYRPEDGAVGSIDGGATVMDGKRLLAIHHHTEFVWERLKERVDSELIRQDRQWGIQDHPLGNWQLILDEELGEMAKAILQGRPYEAVNNIISAVAVLVRMHEKVSESGR